MDETLLTKVEENLDDTPQEVQDFLFGDDFKSAVNEVVKNIPTNLEKETLINTLRLFLLGVKSIDELSDYIDTLTVAADIKLAIKRTVQEKIIDELLLVIEVNEEMDKNIEPSTAPTTPTALTTLADRLKNSSIAASAKRDLSLNMPSSTKTIAGEIENNKPAIDPYHEAIDNE